MRAVSPRTWLEETSYRELPFRESLAAFAEKRHRFVATISMLSPEQWLRDGMFPGGGKARLYTVHSEADALARHERSHLRQFEQKRVIDWPPEPQRQELRSRRSA